MAIYEPSRIVGYPDPVAEPGETREGQALDEQFFTRLTRAVAGSGPRFNRVGMVVPTDGQIAAWDASSGAASCPLGTQPVGSVVGVVKTDPSPNTITIVAGSLSIPLRLRGHAQLLVSAGEGTWHTLTNGLPLDALEARLDTRYDARYAPIGSPGSGAGGSGGGPSRATVYDDFTTKPDGDLQGVTADDEGTWTAVSFALRSGKAGPPAGHTPGGTGGSGVAAGYAFRQLTGTVGRVYADLVFDASDSVASSACIGAFTQTNVTASSGGSNAHCAITPYGLQFGCFTAGSDELAATGYLVPDGYDPTATDAKMAKFPTPLRCDGTTTYRVEVVLDWDRARAYVTVGDFPTVTFTDPRIRSVAATWAFVEWYSVTGGSNLVRFTRMGADPVAVVRDGPSLAAAAAGATNPRGGAGPASSRPPSRMRPGATWWETGVSTTLAAATAANATTFVTAEPIPVGAVVQLDSGLSQETRTVTARSGSGPYTHTVAALLIGHSSGAPVVAGARPTWSDAGYWRDSSGVVIGNRIPANVATASEDGTLLNAAGCTAGQARAPVPRWRIGRSHKITCTTAGSILVYPSSVLAEPGAPFFAGLGQVIAATAARSATLALRFYSAAGAQLGSDVTRAATIPTGSTPVDLLTPAAVAPAGTTTALAVLTIAGCAVGDVFHAVDFTVAPGSVPAHVRT